MATNEHKFRYILKPGNDFRLIRQMRAWVTASVLLCVASIGMLFINKAVHGDYMNWTIDFKGGTEMVLAFNDKDDPTKHVEVEPAKVRDALTKIGAEGIEISEMSWEDGGKDIPGMVVKTPKFGAASKRQKDDSKLKIEEEFAGRGIQKVSWSGDRVFVRSMQPIADADMAAVLKGFDLELKPTDAGQAKINAEPNKDTREYNATFTVHGLDRQYEEAIEAALGNVDVKVMQSHGVGAKAGDKLRNDGIKALFYAMLLIMLYLAVRFDIRYAPGAVLAMIHDALMVIGVFALTWTEVSLTSVAALLTVIGFSVNDTVIIFDRIRENLAKMKDKKVERIVEISLNEVLVRSVLTSVMLFATTLMMNLFGTGLVKDFAFAMNVGIIVGVYSSIFLAPPIFLWMHRRYYMGPAAKPRRRPAGAEAA